MFQQGIFMFSDIFFVLHVIISEAIFAVLFKATSSIIKTYVKRITYKDSINSKILRRWLVQAERSGDGVNVRVSESSSITRF